jgi:N-acetylmuramoyl-L-alanine amidase
MSLFKFCFLVLLFAPTLLAQEDEQFIIQTSKGTSYIPAYERQGTFYFSAKSFAEAVSLNYFINEGAGKIELKSADYSVKISARNPYIIFTSKKDNGTSIIQLPTSTYLIKGHIYIPAKYVVGLLGTLLNKKIDLTKPNQIIIKDETPNEKDPTVISTPGSFNVFGFSMDEKANGTLVTIKSKKRVPSYKSSFKDDVLTITFRKVNVDTAKLKFSGGNGLVKQLYSKNVGEDCEIYFKLGKEFTASDVLNVENSNNVQITLHNKIFEDKSEKDKEKWVFDVVVIDAGHGGVDAGAIGVGGVKEKDVNLSVALKLGKLLEENMKDIKVVYTRKTDTQVDLYKRGKIANENNGKIFISIHCNSTPKKPSDAEGFEVYLLRPGRTQEAITIAERENSVIQYEENPNRYQKLTDENFILVNMAHSTYMKYSEKFAEMLDKQLTANLKLSSRGVKQAGFYVLVGASMPNVLIETGFLSNTNDAAFLKSKDGQQKIAESIFQALKNFKQFYDKQIESN